MGCGPKTELRDDNDIEYLFRKNIQIFHDISTNKIWFCLGRMGIVENPCFKFTVV